MRSEDAVDGGESDLPLSCCYRLTVYLPTLAEYAFSLVSLIIHFFSSSRRPYYPSLIYVPYLTQAVGLRAITTCLFIHKYEDLFASCSEMKILN